jgi:hypothetical protein
MGLSDAIFTANTAPDSNPDSDSDSDSDSESDSESDSDSDSDPDHDSASDDPASDSDGLLQSIPGMGRADVYKGVFGCFRSSCSCARAYASTRAHASTRADAYTSTSTTAAAAAVVFISEQLSRRPERVIHGCLRGSPPG